MTIMLCIPMKKPAFLTQGSRRKFVRVFIYDANNAIDEIRYFSNAKKLIFYLSTVKMIKMITKSYDMTVLLMKHKYTYKHKHVRSLLCYYRKYVFTFWILITKRKTGIINK